MNYKLKMAIIEKFRTQADFADRVSECDSYISLIVRGRRQLSPEKKLAWADALGCKPQDIFED